MRVIDLSTLSMAGGSGIAEVKQSIWWSDGTSANVGNITSATNSVMQDGSAGTVGSTNATSAKYLFTLSSNIPSTQKFAFEVTGWQSGGSYNAYASLWDFTASSVIGTITIGTSTTTATVLRSSQFTLTSGRQYGVALWTAATNTVYISDASLIIFP